MKIQLITADLLDDASLLLGDYHFQPYKEYEIEYDRFVELAAKELSQTASENESMILVAKIGQKLEGLLILHKLNWDTNFFGLKMFDIDKLVVTSKDSYNVASRLISSMICRLSDKYGYVPHISIRIHTEDIDTIHALENNGFRIMNTIVTYYFDFKKGQILELEPSCNIRDFIPEDIPKLREIARESFTKYSIATNRFFADPSLPKVKINEFHATWVENSCKGLADKVLVAEISGQPIGFTTFKLHFSISKLLKKSINSMILSAVSPTTRKRGVYTSMINAGLKWLSDKSEIVEVGTEVANYPVQKAWTRLGFKIVRSQYALARMQELIS